MPIVAILCLSILLIFYMVRTMEMGQIILSRTIQKYRSLLYILPQICWPGHLKVFYIIIQLIKQNGGNILGNGRIFQMELGGALQQCLIRSLNHSYCILEQAQAQNGIFSTNKPQHTDIFKIIWSALHKPKKHDFPHCAMCLGYISRNKELSYGGCRRNRA